MGIERKNRQQVISLSMQLIYPESHDKPGQDVLERYIQMKSSEIYSLLGQMQTCMSYNFANLSNIKPRHSLPRRSSEEGGEGGVT